MFYAMGLFYSVIRRIQPNSITRICKISTRKFSPEPAKTHAPQGKLPTHEPYF